MECSLSAACKLICMSNSPHPSSAILNGGFLKAVVVGSPSAHEFGFPKAVVCPFPIYSTPRLNLYDGKKKSLRRKTSTGG